MLTPDIIKEIENSKFEVFSGLDYLKIDIANNFGLDKKLYHQRIEFVNNFINKNNISSTTTDKELVTLIKEYKAEEPVLTFAGLKAYIDTLNHKDSGYMVAFDSTSSGSQIMAILTMDIQCMYLTNTLGNTRNDLYTIGTEVFNKIANSLAKFPRKDVKKAIMTSNYGSKAKPKQIFGANNIEYFYQAMNQIMPNVQKLKDVLIEQWDSNADVMQWVMPDNYHVYIPVIDKVGYQIDYQGKTLKFSLKEQRATEKGLSNCANLIHSLDAYIMRETIRRCSHFKPKQVQKVLGFIEQYDLNPEIYQSKIGSKYKLEELLTMVRGHDMITIRLLDYITRIEDISHLPVHLKDKLKEILVSLSKYKPFESICIHDSFKSHPNNMNYIRYWYKEILAELAESNCLYFLLAQFIPNGLDPKDLISIPDVEFRKEIAKYIRQSNYNLC